MELKEYLRRVYELEKSCYEQRRLIAHMNWNLQAAKNPKFRAHERDREAKITFGSIIFYFLLLLFLPGVTLLSVEFFLPSHKIAGNTSLHLTLFTAGAIPALLIIIGDVRSKNKRRAKLSKINQNIDSYNQSLQRRAASQVAALPQQIGTAKNTLVATQQTLQQFYGLNVIFPKYRNFVAVSMFYEYLCSGRCSALEGHEGAYNIYEQEIRMNLILSKLDEVIAHLDRIEDNQYMLASAIREGNAKADQIYQTLQNVESNTAASAYFSEVSAMNTTYMAWFRKNL